MASYYDAVFSSINELEVPAVSVFLNSDGEVFSEKTNGADIIGQLIINSEKQIDFIKEMNYAYAAADIIISRAGALAISELSIVAKPVIFVPYPFAAEDHQKANALSLVNRHAASMVLDKDIDKELLPKLISLLQDEAICNQYAHQLNKIAITNADELIANHIIAIAS
jgi:UDP-N-acetylglucosamine--N-acetylmuramyl-(pentapeptide) pyrophosphoryl-undecaprenol N-acetylglucosamine transferase